MTPDDDPHLTPDENRYDPAGALRELVELLELNPVPESPEGLRLGALADRLEASERLRFLDLDAP